MPELATPEQPPFPPHIDFSLGNGSVSVSTVRLPGQGTDGGIGNKGVQQEAVKVSGVLRVTRIMSVLLTNPRWLRTSLGVKAKAVTMVYMVRGLPFAFFYPTFQLPPPQATSSNPIPPHRALTLSGRRLDAPLLGGSKFCPRYLSEVSQDQLILLCSPPPTLFSFPA